MKYEYEAKRSILSIAGLLDKVPIKIFPTQTVYGCWSTVFKVIGFSKKLWSDNHKRRLTVPDIALLPIGTVTTKPATIGTNTQLQKKKVKCFKMTKDLC